MQEKIILLRELNDIYFWGKNQVNMQYYHVIKYVEEDGGGGDAWEGKMVQMTKLVQNLQSQVGNLRKELKD
jgi:hypothetical protein